MSQAEETRADALDDVVDRSPRSDTLGPDLFAVVDALESSAALRRALTDPGTSEAGRQALAHGVLDGKVSEAAVQVVVEAAALRWAGGRSLAAALERQAVRAILMNVDAGGQLEEVEDELFRFARLVDSAPELRNALADRSLPVSHRQELVDSLLAGKASPTTTTLAKRAVAARERTYSHTLEGYIALAAAQKNRVIATVRVAQPITVEQASRLQAVLSRQVGREVALQVIVDHTVLGGARVHLGDEVIEGTVGGRLEEVKRLFG